MVKSAAGVVSERRFSGLDRTPNMEQVLWTNYNMLVDIHGPDILKKSKLEDLPDYFVYELSKHMNKDDMVDKIVDARVTDVNDVIERHMTNKDTLKDKFSAAEAHATRRYIVNDSGLKVV